MIDINIVFSTVAVVLSLVATIITISNYYRDRARLIINFSIMRTENKKFIRYYIFNTGRRSTTIKDIGAISWKMGGYSVKRGKNIFKKVDEKGWITFDEDYKNRYELADIRYLAVQDVTGKIWTASKATMKGFCSYVYSTGRINTEQSNQFSKPFYKARKKSLLAYLKFIRKNKLDNMLENNIAVIAGDQFMSEEILNKFISDETQLKTYRDLRKKYTK